VVEVVAMDVRGGEGDGLVVMMNGGGGVWWGGFEVEEVEMMLLEVIEWVVGVEARPWMALELALT